MSQKFVSIIVLTYNSEKVLQTCLQSIFNQTYENYEVVIVDNNSTDGTKDILANIATKNSNYKIILHEENLGYNLGNQIGIENSKGEFITFVNPDSFLDKSWLSNIIQVFDSNQNTMIVSGILENIDQTIQSTGGQMDRYGAVKQRKENIENYFYALGAAIIFKKEILTKVELDPNLFMYYDDVDLSWQLRLLGYKINFCEKSISYHNQISEQLPISKFYHISKNRVYVCSKNYSLNRITRRILVIVGFVILDSLYYSFKFKSPKYFFSGLKALGWNIISANKLRISRSKIQKHRIVSDEKIESFMQKKSIEMKFLKSKF